MNPQKTTITILATLSVSIALADDFKTINGKEYKNVTVSRVEADGIVIKGKSGILKVYFVELPKDVQERFAVQQGEKINHEVSLKDYPGVRGGPPKRSWGWCLIEMSPSRRQWIRCYENRWSALLLPTEA